MKMPTDRTDELAAAWFARLLSPDCSDGDREKFEQWCAASDRHADAFAAVAQCHQDAGALRDDELMRAAVRAARHATRHADHRSAASRWARLATAAILLLAIAGGTFWFVRDAPMTSMRYATAVGEQRSVSLADGTRVQLDTDTSFTARFGSRTRQLVLDHGRIQVEIAEDGERAFSVLSGRGLVRDIGTEFQVERYGEDVTVTLLAGIVSVELAGEATSREAASVLSPGQQLHVGGQGGLGPATSVDLALVSGWTGGTLTFKDRQLGDLLDEMNRYSSMKIRVADPALSRIRVSGVFRAGDQSSLLQALQTGWSMRSTRVSPGEVVLSSAR
jgi:transmembrane sensor